MRIPNSLYEVRLQGTMVVVFVILGICFDESSYHDSLQARLIE